MLLLRVSDNDIATYGVLVHGATPFALTLERPWRENRRGESCIPAGNYECRRVQSPRFGNTFEVVDVPGRQAILFHKGNIDDDTHGCILVGEAFNPVRGKPGIAASEQGYNEFMTLMQMTNKFVLQVVDAFRLVNALNPALKGA